MLEESVFFQITCSEVRLQLRRKGKVWSLLSIVYKVLDLINNCLQMPALSLV